MATAVVTIGLLITAVCSWTAWTLDRNNEHRLLVLQTRQAGSVIASSIVGIESPLMTTAELAAANGGDPSKFAVYATQYFGPNRLFAHMSLWKSAGPSGPPILVASLGLPAADPSARSSTVSAAVQTSKMVVRPVYHQRLEQVTFAMASVPGSGFVVYAERPIPASRRAAVEQNSAFADLHFATYLGRGTNPATLATTDVPLSELPLSNDTARVVVPFGDTALTLVASPKGQLGGNFGADLPWFFLVTGLVLTTAIALVSAHLRRRHTEAVGDARTIADLYDQLDALYAEQHTIADALQKALLPKRNPDIPGVDIASRYVAGADRVDIGGDWYSVVRVDQDHYAFVVGDVSGRGISAATVMARLRFTLRAYLVEGHTPATALDLCSRQITVAEDGHLASALVGLSDVTTGVVTLANAGHLAPLLVANPDIRFVETDLGLPLGVGPSTYLPVSFTMPRGATLVVFTDGLIERRGEILDVGMDRLAEAARSHDPDLDRFLSSLIGRVASPDSTDDMAVLALRWNGPSASRPSSEHHPGQEVGTGLSVG